MVEKNTDKASAKKPAAKKAPAKKAAAPKVKEAAKAVAETVKKVVKKASKVDEKAPVKAVKATKEKAAPKAAAKKTTKKVNAQRKLRTIELNYYSPASESVEVAGTFNKWKPAAMSKAKDGVWSIKVELEPGNYEYKLVFDGASWEVDPNAPTIHTDLGPNNILQVD